MKFQGCFKDVSSKFQGCFKKFQVSFMDVSSKVHGCFKDVSKLLKVSRMIKELRF